MMSDFRRTFSPTVEEQREDQKRYAAILRNVIEKKACCVCRHYHIIPGYHLGFVTGGDEECDTGRCPIETCVEYEFDEDILKKIEALENTKKK